VRLWEERQLRFVGVANLKAIFMVAFASHGYDFVVFNLCLLLVLKEGEKP